MARKRRKLPKAPKMTASISTFENWKKRAMEVKKYNAAIDQEKKRKVAIINAIRR